MLSVLMVKVRAAVSLIMSLLQPLHANTFGQALTVPAIPAIAAAAAAVCTVCGHPYTCCPTLAPNQTPGFLNGHRRSLSQQQGIIAVTTDAVNVPCNSATALRRSQLTKGRVMWTALEGAMPLDIDGKDAYVDDVEVELSDNRDAKDADIKVPDIQAGRSIVHIVDEALIPTSIRTVVPAAGLGVCLLFGWSVCVVGVAVRFVQLLQS
jgi:hypothetical protein